MSLKWSPNWLLLFTVILFLTASVMFVVSQRNQLGLKKCAYGDEYYSSGEVIPGTQRCFCDKYGKVVCEEEEVAISEFDASSYTSDGLLFSYKFLNSRENTQEGPEVRFSEISTKENGLKIVVERSGMCGSSGQLPPQMGYYMIQGDELYLTISSNLLAGDYGQECFVSATYNIDGLSELSESFKIYFQTESKEIFNADICIFNGKVFNTGDAFVGKDGEVVVCNID